MHLAVETDRLKRVFTTRGVNGRPSQIVVLNDVTLSVRRGELFGLLGVNGAGKSTLLQILATQLRPTSGTAKVAGFDVCRYATSVAMSESCVWTTARCCGCGRLNFRQGSVSGSIWSAVSLRTRRCCCSTSRHSGSTARPRATCVRLSAAGCMKTRRGR